MTAKVEVRKVAPHARSERYRTNGGRGYTLIFCDGKRLGEGKTTDQAWRNALKNLTAARFGGGS